jgi:hypothetical protein
MVERMSPVRLCLCLAMVSALAAASLVASQTPTAIAGGSCGYAAGYHIYEHHHVRCSKARRVLRKYNKGGVLIQPKGWTCSNASGGCWKKKRPNRVYFRYHRH